MMIVGILSQPVVTAQAFDPKAFDAAVTLAQSLTQWGFLIIAGSVVIVVGTSYYRPNQPFVRGSYLLFLLAWLLMGMSIFRGIQVQMANVARLFESSTNLAEVRRTMTHDANAQIRYMEWSLWIFGIWLLFFSVWWVFHTPPPNATGKVP
ncbi:MAG: hypothetical protein WBV69_12060 [Candidatus Sulfotelmatobacter sp.]